MLHSIHESTRETLKILESIVRKDEFTARASEAFDYEFDGKTSFTCFDKPPVPDEFSTGLIMGPSGSGKSSLLKEFGEEKVPHWNPELAIVSHFETPDEAMDKLSAVGFNSIPSWLRPYHALSTGEKFRADLARKLQNGAVIDEFTSVVNRDVAKSASYAISKYIKRNNLKNIVFASCHEDIKDWLEPEWTFDTSDGSFTIGRWLRRIPIRFEIYKCTRSSWKTFSQHHYLSADLNQTAKCYLCYWEDKMVGFNGTLFFPGYFPPLYEGDNRNSVRASRTVILPDFQGLGIGVRFSDALGQLHLDQGYRYFSKTAHFRFGEYRQKHDWWRATATNLKKINTATKDEFNHWLPDASRICYSHEYIGKRGDKHRELYELGKKS